MNIELSGTGAISQLFTDMDTGGDYAVAPWNPHGWEHLYMIADIDRGRIVNNVDGATPEEALRNYLELGDMAVAELHSWNELQDQGRKSATIDIIQRPGTDKEYKARGVDSVYTVSWAGTAFKWIVFENGSDDYVVVEADTGTAAVVKRILDKEKGEHNA